MKIFGISAFNLNSTQQKYKFSDFSRHYSQYPSHNLANDTFTRTSPEITFGANIINNPSKFKKLVRTRTMHCIYCNKVLVDEEELNKLERNGVFTGPIKDFVNKTQQYYPSMHKAQRTVFRIISRYATQSPQTTLAQVMQSAYPSALNHLRKSQKPMFEELAKYAEELPPEYKKRKNMQKNYLLNIKKDLMHL